MHNRLRIFGVVLLFVCFHVASGPLGPTFGQEPKGSIAALFEGIPADLTVNVRANSVRRDRVNDWLSDNVDGKGKVLELDLPVKMRATRDPDKTYTVELTGRLFLGFGPGGGIRPDEVPPFEVKVLGGTWPVRVDDGRGRGQFRRGDGGGGPGSGGGGGAEFVFVKVSTADAEKLVELNKIRLQGKVKSAHVDSGAIGLILEDVLLDGKKLTPREEPPAKGKGKKGKGPVAGTEPN